MNQSQLIKQIAATIGKQKILELGKILAKNEFNLHDLIELTLHPEPDIAFRAAWLLENVFLKQPESYLPELQFMLKQMLLVKSASGKRHYAKIVMHVTDPRAPRIIVNRVSEIDFEPVVELLFDWMIDPKVKIAVKAFAAEALFNLRHRYEWIADQLTSQLQFLMRDGTAAIQSKRRKLLKELAPSKPHPAGQT